MTLAVAGAVGFAVLAFALQLGVLDSPEAGFNQSIRRLYHGPDAPLRGWLDGAIRDITALGSIIILWLVVIIAAAFFLLGGLRIHAAQLFGAFLGGMLLNAALKSWFARPRPGMISRFVEVESSSFPSGHALLSTTVYLTLGWLLAWHQPDSFRRRILSITGLALPLLVGLSRVLLGAHYPSDVIAGWLAGTSWVCLCIRIRQSWEQRQESSGHQAASTKP